MPIYEFKCSLGHITEAYCRTDKNASICGTCGKRARKIISLPSTDLKENIRFSSTMGVNPDQIPAAIQRFPGSQYTKDGRLIIHNRKEKLQRVKERGYIEFD